MDFPDVTIAVKNIGKINWELLWDGRTYRYPVGKVVTVPYLVAHQHFGVELKNGHLVRDRRQFNDEGKETQFYDRLSSIEPKGLLDYAGNKYANMSEYEKYRDSFINGLEFGIQPRQSSVAMEMFDKFKALETID